MEHEGTLYFVFYASLLLGNHVPRTLCHPEDGNVGWFGSYLINSSAI